MSRCTDGHPALSVQLRRKPAVGGGEIFVRQCMTCGEQVGGSVPLKRVPDPRGVPLFDSRLAHRPQPTARKRDYAARFKAPDWKKLRARVLARDGYACRNCGESATEVHHLTYDRFGEERLDDLAASCGPCNRLERERRIAQGVLG